jgi:hypothetical protein
VVLRKIVGGKMMLEVLARVCEDCKNQKLSKFRPEVLNNPQYEASEPIEPEE